MNPVIQGIIKRRAMGRCPAQEGIANSGRGAEQRLPAPRTNAVSRHTFYRVKEASRTVGLETILREEPRHLTAKNRIFHARRARRSFLRARLDVVATFRGAGSKSSPITRSFVQ